MKFAPIEFNDKINNVGILSSSYMGEILLWPWQWGERKYRQASVSLDTAVRPQCLVDNKKSYSIGHNRPVFNILVRRGESIA